MKDSGELFDQIAICEFCNEPSDIIKYCCDEEHPEYFVCISCHSLLHVDDYTDEMFGDVDE